MALALTTVFAVGHRSPLHVDIRDCANDHPDCYVGASLFVDLAELHLKSCVQLIYFVIESSSEAPAPVAQASFVRVDQVPQKEHSYPHIQNTAHRQRNHYCCLGVGIALPIQV